MGCSRMRIAWLALGAVFASATATAGCDVPSGGVTGALPPQFSFAAVGDAIIQRPAGRLIRQRAPLIAQQLSAASVSFGNFETNSFELQGFSGRPRAHPDGFLLLAPPIVPRELHRLGLSLVSVANNHAGDFGSQGMLATARTLREAGLVSAGTGSNQASAIAAGCVRTQGAVVALVAATSTFMDGDAAIADRPGVDALHLARHDERFVLDDADLQALLGSIRDARRAAALVLFSLHAHEADSDPRQPPDFEVRLAHAAVDAGADVFIGHGPHQLRGIEIYRGRPIFYSLGNFAVMQAVPQINPHPAPIPAGSIFTQRAFFEGVLATGRYLRGRLTELRLYPFELADTGRPDTHGLPQAVSTVAGRAILERLRTLSRPFGTEIRITAGAVGVVDLTGPGGTP